jgi:Uma2 family endonuclease
MEGATLWFMGTTTTLMTAEQLLARAGEGRAELVYGELVELLPRGFLDSTLVGRLLYRIMVFLETHPLGTAGTELGMVLARDPDLVYTPDVFFIAKDREPAATSRRFFEGAPDLAIEVLSPDDRPGKRNAKIRAYSAGGTRLVWVVDPDDCTVTVHRPSAPAQVYSGRDEVTGEDVLPGFSFRVERLFQMDL